MKRENWLEWVVLAGSAVVIAAVAAYLAYAGVTQGTDPPNPTAQVRMDEARQLPSAWVVPVLVVNEGDEAAETVRFEAIATVAGKEESREFEIDFLAQGTEVKAEVAFTARPAGEIEVRLIGYRLP
jgi:uncharacterized protein (TIGR02588 family)